MAHSETEAGVRFFGHLVLLISLSCFACPRDPTPRPDSFRGEPQRTVTSPVSDNHATSERLSGGISGAEPLVEGIRLAEWNPVAAVQARVVTVDLAQWKLRALIDPPGLGSARRHVREMAEDAGARVAVNGGFFGSNGEVVGLRVHHGHSLSPLVDRDWGVFYVKDGRASFVHTRDIPRWNDWEFGVQCGPRLVADGHPLKLLPSQARRTVLASTAKGSILLVVTMDPVDLNDLAFALARPPEEGGLGAVQALNLDGGPSSQLYVQGKDASWSILGDGGIADAVAVVPRGEVR